MQMAETDFCPIVFCSTESYNRECYAPLTMSQWQVNGKLYNRELMEKIVLLMSHCYD